jgi:glycosyltransferase involved in cell wall biosynthesis
LPIYKKIISLGPGFSNIIVTGSSREELEINYKKEMKKIFPLIGGSKEHTIVDEVVDAPEPKRLIDTHKEKMSRLVKKSEKVKLEPVVNPKAPPKISKKSDVDVWPGNDKPRIVCVSDVKGWAWWIKSQYLIKHLSDDFNFMVIAAQEQTTNWKNLEADLYITFGWDYFHRLGNVDKKRVISGITAHKGKDTWNNGVIRTLKQCQWVHANSIMLKEALEAGGIKDIYYVPNGVDEELFVEKKSINIYNEKFVAGHVGKLGGIGGKGQKEILEPAAKQAEVVWKGHYNNYRNRVEHTEMVDFYQDIDVFCVASTTDGTPNGALEAAACGRPILSNHIGNMPEFIQDGVNGFLIERKVEDYVEKLNYLKNNKELCYEMGQNARKTIEEGWTWTIMAENYRSMFWDILKKIG